VKLAPFALSVLMALSLGAAYIPDSGKYTLLSEKQRNYKTQMLVLTKAGLFSVDEVNEAIGKDTHAGLSAFVRAIAYDAAGEGEEAEAYTADVKKGSSDFIKITAMPEPRLVLCDIYLRQGRYDEIIALLPKLEFLLWDDRSQIDRAYYYRGMAHYLKTGEFNNDYLIAKGRFPVARDIYNSKKGRIK